MKFRPCIDLHDGQVKQIVGSTLIDGAAPTENFVSAHPPAWFAKLYAEKELRGGHVIKLGRGNDAAAREALAAAPGWLQVGGGIDRTNALEWLDTGASQVIVTSSIFTNGQLDWDELRALSELVGKERLVLDLSCRWRDENYWIVMDRWQRFTDTPVDAASLERLSTYCNEFLVHGVDVEGKQQGMDERLIALLAKESPIPVVYAGGVRALEDLQKLRIAGSNRIDVTVGSALDLFGGNLPFEQVVEFCD